MKYLITAFFAFVIMVRGESQVDSDLAKRISISGFCLCQTSLTSLKNIADDVEIVDIEEMDLPKTCIGQDSRFTNGKGYTSKQYPGLVFQIGNESDYFGKIRLTKDFHGMLPNGATIELAKLKLSDVFQLYPEFKDTWGSRGCSDYWRFSNDTLSFYVKIDKNIQPQFPINESYYYDKPIEGAEIVVSCYNILNKRKTVNLFNENDPLIFLDSIRVNQGILNLYEPSEIAFLNVYKNEDAIRVAGKEAKNGAIYIITKDFARDTYWEYFKSNSEDYKRLVSDLDKEKKVVYILNGKKLDKDIEKDLFEVNNKNLIEISVVDKKAKKKLKLSSDQIVIQIKTK